MARARNRYTQRMLDAANCRHRFEIEFVKNLRRKENEKWFPPKLKELVAEMLYARDYAIASGYDAEKVDGLVSRMKQKWTNVVTRHRLATQETNAAAIEILDEAQRIVDHYSNVNKADYAVKPVLLKKKPAVRVVSEARLKNFEKKTLRGLSKYTFAASIDRMFFEVDKYKLVIRHFTSSVDADEVRKDLELRIDVAGIAWSAEKLLKKTISSVVFDVVRLKPPAVPALLSCKKCNGEGRVKAQVGGVAALSGCESCRSTGVAHISTARCDTTPEIWIDTYSKFPHGNRTDHQKQAVEQIIGALHARGETFCYRVEVPVRAEAIDRWLADTFEIIREVELSRKRGTYPRNTSECGSGHTACPYRRACAGAFDTSEVFFQMVEEDFPGIETW